MYSTRGQGFINKLLDFSFEEFISIDVIRVLYVVSILLAAIAVVVGVITAFTNSVTVGIGALILAPVVLFVYVLFARVLMEIFIVIFKIADHLKEIEDNTSKSSV